MVWYTPDVVRKRDASVMEVDLIDGSSDCTLPPTAAGAEGILLVFTGSDLRSAVALRFFCTGRLDPEGSRRDAVVESKLLL
jgi:hypothetical protein